MANPALCISCISVEVTDTLRDVAPERRRRRQLWIVLLVLGNPAGAAHGQSCAPGPVSVNRTASTATPGSTLIVVWHEPLVWARILPSSTIAPTHLSLAGTFQGPVRQGLEAARCPGDLRELANARGRV